MAKDIWSDRYLVGIKSIDIQHRKLVDLVVQLNELVRSKKTSEVGSIFTELIIYTDTHFKTEEEYFKKYLYPQMAEHKKIHDDLRRTVVELNARYLKGENIVTIELINFLSNWVTSHILTEDKKYSQFLKEKGLE